MTAKEITAATLKELEKRANGWSYNTALRCIVSLREQPLFSLQQARRLLKALEWMSNYIGCREDFLMDADLSGDTQEADLRSIWEEVKDLYQ